MCEGKKVGLILLVIALLIGPLLFGQDLTSDTPDEFTRDSIKIAAGKIVRPQFRVDARTSSFEGQKINIYGYDVGVLISNRLRLALGYYRINNDLPEEVDLNGSQTKLLLNVNCGALNTEVTYYEARYLSLGFPLEFAFGTYKMEHHDANSDRALDHQSGVLGFTNFGLSATLKPIRWFGLKGIAGYRKSLYPNEKTFGFNGVFSSIGLNADVQEIVKDIKMYKLMKRHNRNFHGLTTLADLVTN
jgi:hypothetical protein